MLLLLFSRTTVLPGLKCAILDCLATDTLFDRVLYGIVAVVLRGMNHSGSASFVVVRVLAEIAEQISQDIHGLRDNDGSVAQSPRLPPVGRQTASSDDSVHAAAHER